MNRESNLLKSLIWAAFNGRMDVCFHESRTDTPAPYILSVNAKGHAFRSDQYAITFRWPCRNERNTGGMYTGLDVTVTFTHDNDGHISIIDMTGPEGLREPGDGWCDLENGDDLVSFMDQTCEYLIHAWNYHWCQLDDICNAD